MKDIDWCRDNKISIKLKYYRRGRLSCANVHVDLKNMKKNIKKYVKKLYMLMLRFPMSLVKIKENKVVFVNYQGKGYGDNPKYIANELRNNPNIDLVWLLRSDINNRGWIPKNVRVAEYGSFSGLWEMATAKVWISNCRLDFNPFKKKKQYYIQTWHGDIGLKKAEADSETSLSEKYVRLAKNDSKMIDLFIGGNQWFSNVIKRAYWYSGKIEEIGTPRRDIFYNYSIEDIKKIKMDLGVNINEKLFLYAPTFRKKQDYESFSVYGLDFERVKKALEKRFGGTWRGLVRLHPNVSEYNEQLRIPESVIDVTNYPDMQELLLISDCCITDYSSAIFDFAVTGKIGFIYAEDIEEYEKDRGMLFAFSETPFACGRSNNEIENIILNFNDNDYKYRNKMFYSEKIGLYDDGNASKHIADVICKVCLLPNNNL